MRVMEKATPAAAIVAALSTLACCMPVGFLAVAGFAGLSALILPLRPWLLALSVALLLFGFAQLYLRRNQCPTRSRTSLALFWLAVVIVALVIMFPQAIASWIAG